MIAPSPIFTRPQIASITAAIACVSACGVGISLSVPLLSLEMERMGVSGTLIGVNTAVAGVASICVVPFVPRLAARVGVLRLIWLAVIVGGLSLIAFKVFFSFAWWFPLRFVFAASLGTLFVLSEYWINAAAPPGRRGLVMGIYATVLALGFAAGPAVLAVVGTSGWPPYLAGTLLFALAAFPLVLARDLSPELDEGPRRSVISLMRVAPTATLAAFTFGAIETGGFAILPVYGLRLGFDAQAAAFLVSLLALGNVLCQIPIGLLADRLDRRHVLLVAGLAGIVGAALLPLVYENRPVFYAVLLVWGGLTGALYTVGLAHLGARFSGGDLVSANAAFVILYNVGLVAGPAVVGGAMDALPPHGFAWSLAGFAALYSAVVLARLVTARPEALTPRPSSGMDGR